jgi:putative membrane protein
MLKLILLTTLLALLGTSCSSDKKSSKTAKEEVSANITTDEEISNVLMTANTQEMTMAQIGKEKASHPKIKAFAAKMFTEHARNNDMVIAWSKRKDRLPEETKASRKMKLTAESKMEELKELEGDEFDRVYMETQVKLHQKVLDKIDSTLIPNARDVQLRTMLQHTRGKVADHLKVAKEIQKSI